MKLYCTNGVWTGSQAEAATERKRIRGEGQKNVETTTVEVPTKKEELIAFLNTQKVVPTA